MKNKLLFDPSASAKRCCTGLYKKQLKHMWSEIEAFRDNPSRDPETALTSNITRATLGVRTDKDQYQGCVRLRTLRSLLQIIDEETAFERSPHQQVSHTPCSPPRYNCTNNCLVCRNSTRHSSAQRPASSTVKNGPLKRIPSCATMAGPPPNPKF